MQFYNSAIAQPSLFMGCASKFTQSSPLFYLSMLLLLGKRGAEVPKLK
jgi:hypothetical protein